MNWGKVLSIMLISVFMPGCGGVNSLKVPDNTSTIQEVSPPVPIYDYNLGSKRGLEVGKGQTVTQTFTVSRTMFLSGIEVSMERCQALETDTINLEFGRGKIPIGTVSITGAGLSGPGHCETVPAELQLSTIGPGYFDLRDLFYQMISGQTYYFKLSSSSDRGFIVGTSSDVYAGGTALVNGDPSVFDLTFKIVVSSSEFGTSGVYPWISSK